MMNWLRRVRWSVWTEDPKATPYDPRPIWKRLQVFFGIRGRF